MPSNVSSSSRSSSMSMSDDDRPKDETPPKAGAAKVASPSRAPGQSHAAAPQKERFVHDHYANDAQAAEQGRFLPYARSMPSNVSSSSRSSSMSMSDDDRPKDETPSKAGAAKVALASRAPEQSYAAASQKERSVDDDDTNAAQAADRGKFSPKAPLLGAHQVGSSRQADAAPAAPSQAASSHLTVGSYRSQSAFWREQTADRRDRRKEGPASTVHTDQNASGPPVGVRGAPEHQATSGVCIPAQPARYFAPPRGNIAASLQKFDSDPPTKSISTQQEFVGAELKSHEIEDEHAYALSKLSRDEEYGYMHPERRDALAKFIDRNSITTRRRSKTPTRPMFTGRQGGPTGTNTLPLMNKKMEAIPQTSKPLRGVLLTNGEVTAMNAQWNAHAFEHATSNHKENDQPRFQAAVLALANSPSSSRRPAYILANTFRVSSGSLRRAGHVIRIDLDLEIVVFLDGRSTIKNAYQVDNPMNYLMNQMADDKASERNKP